MAGRHNKGFFASLGNLFGSGNGGHHRERGGRPAQPVGRGRTSLKYGAAGKPARTRQQLAERKPGLPRNPEHTRFGGPMWGPRPNNLPMLPVDKRFRGR